MKIATTILLAIVILCGAGALVPGLPLFVIVFAAAVAALGLEQKRFLPGSAHWVVKLLHLATAGYAIGLGRKLAVASRAK